MRFVSCVAASLVALTFSTLASANGRYPFANQLVVAPDDPARLVVRTTYGVLQSLDAGKTWKWICEGSVGYGGTLDPAIGIAGNGRLLVGVFTAGLSTSSDKGCTFGSDAPPFTGMFVNDMAVDPSDPKRIVALGVRGSLAGTFTVTVAESTDDGASFTPTGPNLPDTFDPETIEVAPSRAERLYASGIRLTPPPDGGPDAGYKREGLLYRSDDRGKTWKEIVVDMKGGLAPFVSAVDPADADKIYVRVSADVKTGAAVTDRLFFSTNGGDSFTEIATTRGNMLGFAMSPDGKKIAFGGPNDGVWVGSTTDHVFTKASAVAAQCLTWAKAGMYACGSEIADGFTLGFSGDDGKTFTRLYKLADLTPLDCPAGTTTKTKCPAEWPAVKDRLGIVDPDAGPSDAGTTPDVTTEPGHCNACTIGRDTTPKLALVLAFFLVVAGHGRKRTPVKRSPSSSKL